VEVHDVQGDANNPTSITLKWSSENAAEAYTSGAAPADYKGSDWVYEFHSPTSEKQLGNHLVAHTARRGLDDGYPGTEPPLPWVRRWDGFCVLTRQNTSPLPDWTNASITEGKDRGVALSTSIADDIHGHAEIIATPPSGTPTSLILRLNLQLVDLQLHLKGYSFVAGDYWLAMARDTFVSGQQLLESKPPLGLVHRYLQLGKVVAGQAGALAFQPDRPLAFPTLTDLVADASGASGARRIGAEAVTGNPSALSTGTVSSQLADLLGLVNSSIQRAETRYLRRAGSVTVQLDAAASKAIFTSLTAPAAVTFSYSEFDASGTVSLRQFVNGPKTSQIEVRIDKDNQNGQAGITTDVFWHHVFVTNQTNPPVKLQITADVFLIAGPAVPEIAKTAAKEAKEGKDTTAEKTTTEKTNKDTKDGKDNPDKASKESKENKESKEATEKTNKDTKDGKDNPDKVNKEHKEKEDKEHKENKDAKESKEGKEGKESKESKENKDAKEATKESKEKEVSKDNKEDKEDKEHKDRKETKEDKEEKERTHDKGAAIGAIEHQVPMPPVGLPAWNFSDPPVFEPEASVLDAIPTDQRAFIRPNERPPVGDHLTRQRRPEAPPT
jgi:hypothetical protein